jgi:hypothetical protein
LVAGKELGCFVPAAQGERADVEELEAELHAAVTDLERVLADPTSESLARVDEDCDLIVSLLPAEQIPAEGEALAQRSRLACRRSICPPCSSRSTKTPGSARRSPMPAAPSRATRPDPQTYTPRCSPTPAA